MASSISLAGPSEFYRELLSRIPGHHVGNVDATALLVDDLGFDSFQLLSVLVAVEELAGTEFSDELLAKVQSLADCYAAYLSHRVDSCLDLP